MGQQSSSQSAKEMSATSPKNGGAETTDKGLDELKQGLVKDAGQLTDGLKDLATGVAGDAKHAVEGQLDSQKGRVVEGLGGVADALRRVSTSGNKAEGTAIAPALVPYIEGAADQVERASAYFEKKSLGEVARDVEDFARREPALFLGGAFALGLLGGRFLKASQPAGGNGSYGQSRGQNGGQQGRQQQRYDRPFGAAQVEAQSRNGNSQSHTGNGNDRAQRQAAPFGAQGGSASGGGGKPASGADQKASGTKSADVQRSGSTTPGSQQGSSRGVGDDKGKPNLGANQGAAPQETAGASPPVVAGGHGAKDAGADGKSSGGKTVGS